MDAFARDFARGRRNTVSVALAIRPSFSFDLPVPSRQASEALAAQLAIGSQQLRRARAPGGGLGAGGVGDRDHLLLTVPEAQQRVWSPWLTIDITARDGGSHLFARFGPHPSVWTGFAFGYLTLGIAVVFSLIFTSAQAMVGGGLWALWITAGALVAAAGMWTFSRVGLGLAGAQMEAIRSELDRALAACGFPAAR